MRGREWLWVAGAIVATGALLLLLDARFPGALRSEGNQQSLIYYLAWLGLLGGSLIMHIRRRPIAALKHIAIWAAIMLVLVGGYSYRDVLEGAYGDARARITGELIPERGTVLGQDGVRFNASRDGHFRVEALVNGEPVSFMLDTGASEVVLTPEDAARLGWDPETLDYSRRYLTANGTVYGAPVTLSEMQVGPIRLDDVEASVNAATMDSSLLGMSFLSRLHSFQFEGDTVTLWR